MNNKPKKSETKRWVILCTDENKKGVFYGNLIEFNREKDYAILEDARMIVYWCEKVRGVLGLAKVGAINGCKASSSIPRIELNGISAIIDTTEEAQKTFEQEVIWV